MVLYELRILCFCIDPLYFSLLARIVVTRYPPSIAGVVELVDTREQITDPGENAADLVSTHCFALQIDRWK